MMGGDLFSPITDELQSAIETCTQTHSHQTSHRHCSANNAIDSLEPLQQCGIIITGECVRYVHSDLQMCRRCVIHLLTVTLSEEYCFKVHKGFLMLFKCNKLSQALLNQSG